MKDSYSRDITYLRLSVTDRCNLRCRYCMPSEGVQLKKHSQMLSLEEMILAVRACTELGIKKVRITGGEPLVKKNIVQICKNISSINGIEELCITTNGILLPIYAKDLLNAGVRRINISLDTLNSEKYKEITRLGCIDDAINGIETALNTGFEKIKINTVLIKGFNDNEIQDFANLTLKYPVDVRFIELMPMTSYFSEDRYTSSDIVINSIPNLIKEDCSDGVSLNYSIPEALGKIGIIPAITNKFCSRCNRIRITADGYVKPCLHSNSELCIKNKSFSEMKETIYNAIMSKPLCRPEFKDGKLSQAERFMNQIGG